MNQTVRTIYSNCLEDVCNATEKNARRLGFVTRMFTGRQSDAEKPLFEFDANMKAELNRLSMRHASSAEVREMTEWMLEQMDAQRDNPRIKYAFAAVQRHLIPLVPCLSMEDAALLAELFEHAFPRRERFPSHVELIAALREQAQSIKKRRSG